MITGPAEEAVKKVVKANKRATPTSGATARLIEKEKKRKKGKSSPNMIIGGVK
jgi:hypothetical protein